MNALQTQIRELLLESKVRLDFDQAAEDLRTFMAEVEGDGTLLPLTRRQMQNLAATALQALQLRKESAVELEHTLLSLDAGEVAKLEEPAAGLLAQWYFHVTYRGQNVGEEALAVASQIISRRQPNPGENNKKLRDSAMRYQWLASWGTNPTLSSNNALGLHMATRVMPLPEVAARELQALAAVIYDRAQARAHLSRAQLGMESLMHCRGLIEAAWKAHQEDPSKFMEPTESFCVRVSLGDVRQIVGECPELADEAETLSSEIETLNVRFDDVAYRSSSTVFTGYKREMASLDLHLEQSIDFRALWERLKALQRRMGDSIKRGRQGVNQLGNFHGKQATLLISNLFEKLKSKRASADQLRLRLREMVSQVEILESQPAAPVAPVIHRAMFKVRDNSALLDWIGSFPEPEARLEAQGVVADLRVRLQALWQRMKAAEAARAQAFAGQCTQLIAAINASADALGFSQEISELHRSLSEEFPASIAKRLEVDVRRVSAAWQARMADPEQLRTQIAGILDEVQQAHRRIFSPVDLELLFKKVGRCRYWADMRYFPREHRAGVLKQIKGCYVEVHKLRARQTRVMAERESRAAELYVELEADIREGVAGAVARPRDPAEWENLVALDRRLRDAERVLKDEQRTSLRAGLDRGFQVVRDARSAFAVESARRFAGYNEVLSRLQAALEESPIREMALEAISQLKPLRVALREDGSLLRQHRIEVYGLLDMVSQSVDEVFEEVNSRMTDAAVQIRADIEHLEEAAEAAVDWNSAYALITVHKEKSVLVRDAQISIQDRKDLRQRLEGVWEAISDKLQHYRFSRTQREDLDTKIRRLEQQGFLLFVSDYPVAA